MSIGETIKSIRLSKNWTQKQLADRMGVTQSWVGMYESGQRRPKMDTLVKIADALGVQLQDLLQDEAVDLYSQAFPSDKVDAEDYIKNGGLQAYLQFADWGAQAERAKRENALLESFHKLNEAGQLTALERLRELSEIPRYQAAKTGIPDPIPAGSKQDEPAPDDSSDGSPKDKV